MRQAVTDLGSNLEENLERWVKALKHGGAKFSVWRIIYSGKRRRWTPKEISKALNGKITSKKATEAGKKLVGDGLIRQADGWPVVYEKIDDVHHYKNRILSLIDSKARQVALRTKRSARLDVKIRATIPKRGKAEMITIDDIDQFSKTKTFRRQAKVIKALPEDKFKAGLQRLFKDTGKYPDWGGESNDFFTNKLKIHGRRHAAAFALKGPGTGLGQVHPGNWGKRGDQIQRLLGAPAQVYLLQSERQIAQNSIELLKKLTAQKAYEENEKLFYGYIDRDDSARLRSAYPEFF